MRERVSVSVSVCGGGGTIGFGVEATAARVRKRIVQALEQCTKYCTNSGSCGWVVSETV